LGIVVIADVRLRLGSGFTRRKAGNSGTSNIGDVARYMMYEIWIQILLSCLLLA
jgi:hypothetical protein